MPLERLPIRRLTVRGTVGEVCRVSRTVPGGFLIAIEGIDGAGKTTQARNLAAELRKDGWDVIQTKEPTDGQWGRKLRESAQTGRMTLEDELRYFIEDRKEHVTTLIRPALEAGKVVIVDRYYLSTVAYQGARGVEVAAIYDTHHKFAPPPNLLAILEVEPKVGIARIRKRGDKANHFETEENLAQVAAIFAKMKFDFLRRINGNSAPEDITRGLLEVLYDGPLSSDPDRPKKLAAITNSEMWDRVAKVGA